jgi:hypothetical protein
MEPGSQTPFDPVSVTINDFQPDDAHVAADMNQTITATGTLSPSGATLTVTVYGTGQEWDGVPVITGTNWSCPFSNLPLRVWLSMIATGKKGSDMGGASLNFMRTS